MKTYKILTLISVVTYYGPAVQSRCVINPRSIERLRNEEYQRISLKLKGNTLRPDFKSRHFSNHFVS